MEQRDRDHITWLSRGAQKGVLVTVPVLDAVEARVTCLIDDILADSALPGAGMGVDR